MITTDTTMNTTSTIIKEEDLNYCPPPGDTLEEVLESLNMSIPVFSDRTGIPVNNIIRLIDGDYPLTAETADKLQQATGVPGRFWLNREASYRRFLKRQETNRKVYDGCLACGENTHEENLPG